MWSDPTSSSTHSCDSRPEADLHNNCSPCRAYERYKNPPETRSVGISVNLYNKDGKPNGNSDDSCFVENSNTNCKTRKKESEGIKTTETEELETQVNVKDAETSELDKELGIINPQEVFSNSFHQQLVLSPRDRCSLSEMAEDDEIVFDEGPFFRALFKLLSNMHNQPYQINLQLTAIFSKLAMMPHPYLHEYLLNPVLPTGKNVPTLFKALQKLAKVFLAQIPKVKNFETIIEQTRQKLLGDNSSEEK